MGSGSSGAREKSGVRATAPFEGNLPRENSWLQLRGRARRKVRSVPIATNFRIAAK